MAGTVTLSGATTAALRTCTFSSTSSHLTLPGTFRSALPRFAKASGTSPLGHGRSRSAKCGMRVSWSATYEWSQDTTKRSLDDCAARASQRVVLPEALHPHMPTTVKAGLPSIVLHWWDDKAMQEAARRVKTRHAIT